MKKLIKKAFRRKRKDAYRGKHEVPSVEKLEQPPPMAQYLELEERPADVSQYPQSVTGHAAPRPTVAYTDASKLPNGYTTVIPVGSTWKRKAPGKQIVKVGRVWYLSASVARREAATGPSRLPKIALDKYAQFGWTVRATPVRGGRTLVADAQWFLDNFDNQDES